MNRLVVLFTVKTILAFANGHVAYPKTPNQLHPVHGLYVKPSLDGTTGDLYVAATEDSGAKTQWLTDQPIHFLPFQAPAVPPELTPQKRAVVNPPPQYSYGLPSANSENSGLPAMNYQYPSIPAASPSTTVGESKAEVPAPAVIPQYNPYQFFYPQMMSAYANMMSILKDVGLSDETASSAVSPATHLWPHSYAYPYQYVMVDPNAWAQAQVQATASPAIPSTTASPTVNETE